MRPFSLALPWVMLAAALGLDALARGLDHVVRLASGRAALLSGAATAVLLLSAAPRVADLVTAPNAMPGLLDYLATAGLRDVASTDGAVLSFWLGEDHTNAKFRAAYINSAEDLEALADHYRVLAVDMQGYLFPNELAQRYAQAQPLFAAPHGSGMWYLASMLEHRGVSWGEWDRLLADWERYRAAATQLRVEDLHVLAESTVAAPHEWAATSR
jgi:membrane protein YqaA with SNARE-associated domain